MAATLQRFLQSDNLPKGVASDTLLLHNRTASKAAALVQELGAGKSIPSPAELGQQATIICLMLADDTACRSTIQELTSAGGQCLAGKVVINHSTNTPEFSKAAAQQVVAVGGTYLAVPVWGR
jgi:3-hydroxyisobutyrate dehydrogenase